MINPESPSKLERIPILKVIISRHGPKASASGEKNQKAPYFEAHVIEAFEGMGMTDNKEGLVHVASSPIQRATDTAEIYENNLEKTKHRTAEKVYKREGLGVPTLSGEEEKNPRFSADIEALIEMQHTLEPEIREEVESLKMDFSPEEKEAMVRNLLDQKVLTAFFSEKDRKIFQTSYEEFADLFADRYKRFLNNTHILEAFKKEGSQPKGEPYIQIDVSHSFPVMSFLKKYLVFEDGAKAIDLSPKDFFERTGGIIRESGSFEMDFLTDNKEFIPVKAEFSKGRPFTGTINFEEKKRFDS